MAKVLFGYVVGGLAGIKLVLQKKTLHDMPAGKSSRDVLFVVPGMRTLNGMFQEAKNAPGRVVQQPFKVKLPLNDATESFSLAVSTERSGTCSWMLYRGEGSGSFVDWSKSTNELTDIATMLLNMFPGFESESEALATPVERKVDIPSADGVDAENDKYKEQIVLEGDVLLMQVPTLLQSVNMERLTGRLEVVHAKDKATLHFNDGVPIHCITKWEKGEAAVMELATWTSGEFKFFRGPKTSVISINRRLNALLLEAATIKDQSQQLTNRGLKDTSYLNRQIELQSEVQLMEATANGTGFSPKLQWEFYSAVDGQSTLVEILRRVRMSKAAWMPSLFNLVDCDVLTFSDEPFATEVEQVESQAVSHKVDWSAVEALENTLKRGESGILSYPAFLLFLRNEFERHHCHGSGFSIMLIEAFSEVPGPDGDKIWKRAALRQRDSIKLTQVLDDLKLTADIIGHFETFGYAMLMPETDETQARIVSERVTASMDNMDMRGPLEEELQVRVSVVSVPQEVGFLEEALGLARSRLEVKFSP
jgi:Domain of unknown function (DUF4388)